MIPEAAGRQRVTTADDTRHPTPAALVPWRLPRPDSQSGMAEYLRSLDVIYAYSDAPHTADDVRLGRAQKLHRMRALLNLLGNPQARFASVLVAGTKGKGSTAAFLASILEAAGYRVGRYTQPHLYSYRERTWALGRFITEKEVAAELEWLGPALDQVQRRASDLGRLTTFDVGTALSVHYFAQVGVEVAVVEVGVGGANDATNTLEPILSLLGPVGLDHAEVLGNTLTEVAREKAGVARRGTDIVVGRQPPEAERAIRATAEGIGARAWELGRHFRSSGTAFCEGGFGVDGWFGSVAGLRAPLVGPCQRDNAAVAVAAVHLLDRRGFKVSPDAIRAGVQNLHWPGRFQTVATDPLTIVDGAHNPAAGQALSATIRECLGARPITFVLGMSAEKDAAAFVSELAPLASRMILTRARHQRACDPAALARAAALSGIEFTVVPSPANAVARAWADQPREGATIVTGSLFLVGDVLEFLLPVARLVPSPLSRREKGGEGEG